MKALTVEEVTLAGAIASNYDVVALVEGFHHRLVLVTLEALYNNLELRAELRFHPPFGVRPAWPAASLTCLMCILL